MMQFIQKIMAHFSQNKRNKVGPTIPTFVGEPVVTEVKTGSKFRGEQRKKRRSKNWEKLQRKKAYLSSKRTRQFNRRKKGKKLRFA